MMNLMNVNLVSLLWCLVVVSCSTPSSLERKPIPTLHSHNFEAISEKLHETPKPIAIFLWADWCTYCKNMQQTTFQDPKVINLLNDQFYFVSFNGEEQSDLHFNGQIFSFQATGNGVGTHELARALGTKNGEIAYPTIVLLNPDLEMIFQYPGYLTADELVAILSEAI